MKGNIFNHPRHENFLGNKARYLLKMAWRGIERNCSELWTVVHGLLYKDVKFAHQEKIVTKKEQFLRGNRGLRQIKWGNQN